MPFTRLTKLLGLRPKKSPLVRRVDHLRKFVSYADAGGTPPVDSFDPARMRITFVIPDFRPGAGGHMTIFRLAHFLEEFGHEVRFLVHNPSVHKSGADAAATIKRHFQPFRGEVEIFGKHTPEAEGDALIATDRFSCFPVNAMQGFIRKFYLVQDFEPSFYPAGSEYLLTESTYRFDFDCLCAGEWLHQMMIERYGRWSMCWPLAFDASVYRLRNTRQRSAKRIALYARYVTDRRAVELAFLALGILKKRGVEFEVDCFGINLGDMGMDIPFRDHGVLNSEELATLYSECAVGLVFSATNHSLVNKEMMACGLPVVDLETDSVRAIFPNDCMIFAEPSPNGIADALEKLLSDPLERDRFREVGLRYVQQFDWSASARLVEAALRTRVTWALTKEGNDDAPA
ncbi:glycosyltransferase family 4 protein [Roseibium sp. CAU 1637]|uniref:Glycosyltransferase family 4 protein n=1 Tax=Roseibium limicola TaxID=2816037 RepID=A0A939JAV9_9HYPH|nr:glycosyltransferase family 4 protein [Roseibium limicola]MBO0346823.1 glycosyltransferase family 4 protein [Roseibium limicola]